MYAVVHWNTVWSIHYMRTVCVCVCVYVQMHVSRDSERECVHTDIGYGERMGVQRQSTYTLNVHPGVSSTDRTVHYTSPCVY